MSKTSRLFEISALSMGLCILANGANAVTSRTGTGTARNAAGNATARMPSMPTLPLISVGNLSPELPSNGGIPSTPDIPDEPDTPDTPDIPDIPDTPPSPCSDGGVQNSDYTVNMCMNDLLRCINNGALPNGLNDMFNTEQRYAIMNGMGLCNTQVDQCIASVRENCNNVYRTPTDVWIDFNYRKVQPEYYNFILRKTGLTPNQAENTCWLIDRNAYGTSFTAVDSIGKTTAEYNQAVAPYNEQQGKVLIKTNPLGPTVNTNGAVDAQRGHYARWDAGTGTCYIRVAAYNKDTPITNKWLFGAAGDDQSAEVWKTAGDTFTCNKDLFGFSLMNKTKTAAVVGVGGGTLLGAGIGAVAGHGARNFDCDLKDHRDALTQELRSTQAISIANEYLDEKINLNKDTMSKKSCREIVRLFDITNQYQSYVDECDAKTTTTQQIEIECKLNASGIPLTETEACYNMLNNSTEDAKKEIATFMKKYCLDVPQKITDTRNCITRMNQEFSGMTCLVKNLNKERMNENSNIYCGATDGSCIQTTEVKPQLAKLNTVLFTSDVREILTEGQKGNRGKTIAAGAAIGAGAGGLATAITAFVEKGNINCRVGDGLAQVGLGKSHSIDTLKDIYVKWNLNLPDVVTPTANVSDCNTWIRTCSTITDLEACQNVEFNWQPTPTSIPKNIQNPCKVSGSTCIPNSVTQQTNGLCITAIGPGTSVPSTPPTPSY